DGPLQPGNYRLTVSTGLTDRFGNPLSAPFVRNFTLADVAPYILESRSNDTLATATTLGTAPGTAPDGSFTVGPGYAVGSNPYYRAAGHLNSDSHLALVTANISSNNVTVLLGNGDGSFQAGVNYPAGSGPIAVAVGDVNGDAKPDLVVANYNASTVSVLL